MDTDVADQPTPQVQNDSTEVLFNLESMIRQSVTGIDKRKSEMKKFQEMVTSFLEQDPTYQEHEKRAKEAAKVKNTTRVELLKQPSVASSIQKAKELKMEIKETQESLSDYLREYQRISGSSEIEDEEGNVRDIVYIARLVKRASRKP